MKFKQKIQAVLQNLKLVDAAKEQTLTPQDWDKIATSYEETYGSKMAEDAAADKMESEKAKTYNDILSLVNEADDSSDKGDKDKDEDPEKSSEATGAPAELKNKVENIIKENKELKEKQKENEEKIEKLSGKLETDKPIDKVTETRIPFQKAHTAEYAFGIEDAMFSMEKRWNKIAANPAYAKANVLTGTQANKLQGAFLNELSEYGESLSARYKELKEKNLLPAVVAFYNAAKSTGIQSAAFDVDYSELDALTKNQYIIRRQDALIAQILQVKTIFDLFPRRYGVQDYDIITNALFTEVSSAWQKGKYFKGDVDLQPETGHVDDASIKVLFEPLTDMERKFIGYLNMEGSDPVKFSMIEWYAMNLLTKAVQEQTKRYVMGIYYKPETGVPGSYLNASTGIMHTIKRYINADKMLAIEDAAVRSYTSATMYDTVKAYLELIDPKLDDQEWEEFTLVLNKRHKQWFIDNLRTTFGQDNDFMGTAEGTMRFPDYDIPIYWLSGMAGNDYTMLLTKPGNIQCIENIPGEMMALVFQDDFEDITVRSRWKEGVSAAFVGPRFASHALLVANDFYQQQIFVNKPVVALAADATTADAANGYHFLTIANTGATAITDITNAKKGVGYYIETGSTTNATTIAQAGKFATITGAWTPTAVGDYLLVVLNDAGTGFLELERKVGGVRTVNTTLQPTLPESRS